MSWGQKTGWDRKQEPQNLIGRSNGMAPTGLPKPRLCQFDWTQLKGKKENANKKKQKIKIKSSFAKWVGRDLVSARGGGQQPGNMSPNQLSPLSSTAHSSFPRSSAVLSAP